MPGNAHAVRFAGVALDWWCPWGLNPRLRLWAGQQSAWTVHRSLWTAARDCAPARWLPASTKATRIRAVRSHITFRINIAARNASRRKTRVRL